MPAPAVFPALAVIAGIAAGVFAPSLKGVATVLLLAMCVLAAFAWRSRRDTAFAVSVLLGFGGTGIVLGSNQVTAAARPPLREFFDQARSGRDGGLSPYTVEGVVRQDAAPAPYGASMTVDAVRVQTACGWLPAAGGLRVAVNGDLARDRLDDWRAGRRLRLTALLRLPAVYRDPGLPDETFGMARRGIALAGSVKSRALVEVVGRGHTAAELAAAIRAYARRAVSRAVSDRAVAAAIVTAILVGDRGGLDPQLERRLQEAGTYHVIAISGGNVAILAGLAFVLLRAARVPRRGASLVLAFVICAYGYVAGGGASVARATLAAAVYLAATAADHRAPALNVLATVALVAVIYDPLAVFDPGLMLSYGATLALLLGADRVLRRRGSKDAETHRDAEVGRTAARSQDLAPGTRRNRGHQQPLSASLGLVRALGHSVACASRVVLAGTIAAELALFPISAFIFHRITLAGLALNFVAIPLMTIAQLGGIAVLLLWPVSTVLARGAGLVAALAADGLTSSTSLLSVAPWLTWRVPTPPIPLLVVYYGGWVGLLFVSRQRLFRTLTGVAVALAAALIAWPTLTDGVLVARSPQPEQLRVTFLDVGQGDSILVQFPGGGAMLIDAAGLPDSSFDLGERVITPAMLALGVRRLEYLAITHGDPDHVEGAPSVARDFRPRELWEGVLVPPHETLRALRTLIAGRRGAARLVRPGDLLSVGPVDVRVLHPAEPDWERQRVRNDDSIVLELKYGDVSIVLPGDIGSGVEETLVGRLSDAPIRILKAAHHGSATSSSDAWLAATRPAAVIFSCGRDNRYGHPAPAVLDRVKSHGAAIFRTDQDGAITVTTDGKSTTVTTFTGRPSVFAVQRTVTRSHEAHEDHEDHEGRSR